MCVLDFRFALVLMFVVCDALCSVWYFTKGLIMCLVCLLSLFCVCVCWVSLTCVGWGNVVCGCGCCFIGFARF